MPFDTENGAPMALDPSTKRKLVRLAEREQRLREQHDAAAAELRTALREARATATIRELAALVERSPAAVHRLTADR